MPQSQDILTDHLKSTIKTILPSLEKGIPPGEFLGMDQNDYDALYAKGYLFYEQGNYDQATQCFAWLILNADRWDVRYYRALGACQAMMGNCEKAMTSYGMAILCKPEDTATSLDAADCLIHAGEWKRASKALEAYTHQCKAMPKKAKRDHKRFKNLTTMLAQKCHRKTKK